MKKSLLILSAAFAALTVTSMHAAMPAGVFAGQWKVNFAKSKFPGPPPQVDECTVDPDGTVHVHEVSADGKTNTWQYTPIAGKAVSVEGRDNTTVLVKKLNPHTNQQVWNINGRAAKSKAIVSNDGKTTTFTMDGVDKDGKPFHELVVYDKQ
jgi:lipocalin